MKGYLCSHGPWRSNQIPSYKSPNLKKLHKKRSKETWSTKYSQLFWQVEGKWVESVVGCRVVLVLAHRMKSTLICHLCPLHLQYAADAICNILPNGWAVPALEWPWQIYWKVYHTGTILNLSNTFDRLTDEYTTLFMISHKLCKSSVS